MREAVCRRTTSRKTSPAPLRQLVLTKAVGELRGSQRITVANVAYLTERDKRFEDTHNTGTACRSEPGGDLGWVLLALSTKRVTHGAYLVGKGCGPRLFAAGGDGCLGVYKAGERGGDGDGIGSLILGAEPAHQTGRFFRTAFDVQGDDAGESRVGGQAMGPAVGSLAVDLENGGI